jgi:hypothetical protein
MRKADTLLPIGESYGLKLTRIDIHIYKYVFEKKVVVTFEIVDLYTLRESLERGDSFRAESANIGIVPDKKVEDIAHQKELRHLDRTTLYAL